MIEILGKNYYIDVDAVIERCRPEYLTTKSKKKDSKDEENTLELNVFKFEVFKTCIERVLSEYDDKEDDIAVFQQKSTPLSFRIAFNTLLKYEILIEDING